MNEILIKELLLHPEDTFSNKYFAFVVPDEAKQLCIQWEKCPERNTDPERCKQIADDLVPRYLPDPEERQALLAYHVDNMKSLGNQMDFTLFCNGEFCGNATYNKRQVFLSAQEATPGFLPKVPHGICTIAVAVFCVYTEECRVSFTIKWD